MASTNGLDGQGSSNSQILQALDLTLNPRTPQNVRDQAREFLDGILLSQHSALNGFTLARNAALPEYARHFGLSALEIAIVRRWDRQSSEEKRKLRHWLIELAQNLRPEDPVYIRHKVALLWVDLAKRTWGEDWNDLDSALQQMWHVSLSDPRFASNKMFVLYILECLSEDTCVREDPIAMLRQEILGQSLNEIFIPDDLYSRYKEGKTGDLEVRSGVGGWFKRVCELLASLAGTSQLDGSAATALAKRSLESLKPTTSWISLEAVLETKCVDCIFETLAYGDTNIRVASIELLLSLLSRTYNPHFRESWEAIFRSATSPSRVEMLRRTFDSAQFALDDIDEVAYTLQKKLSEVLANMADGSQRFPGLLGGPDHIQAFYSLIFQVFSSDSLLISLPVLHSLSLMIDTKQHDIADVFQSSTGILMDTCLLRMIRFETLPESTDHPILNYLREDFETLPELHAFLGNYRRYCVKVVEGLSAGRPIEALRYILGQMQDAFASVRNLHGDAYSKNAIPVVQLEASFTGFRSALSGYLRWMHATRAQQIPGEADTARKQLVTEAEKELQALTQSISEIDQSHPDIARLVVHMVVELLLRMSDPPDHLITSACISVLHARPDSSPTARDYIDSSKTYEADRLADVQRLAMQFPSQLYSRNDEISRLIQSLIDDPRSDDKIKWGYKSLPLILTQRTFLLDEETRIEQIKPMLEPVATAWTVSDLARHLQTFDSFCDLIGLSNLVAYVEKARFSEVNDWSKATLDAEGQALQQHINSCLTQLPLRMTSAMLSASSENLGSNGGAYRVATSLWGEMMPMILPNLLSILRHATGFSNPSNWQHLSPQTHAVIRKMFVDRFWQSGISQESKDDFTARVTGSGKSYEGLASSVRGAPRQIRDSCYYLIHAMTRFEERFYNLPDLPRALSEALLSDADTLSTHHLQRLISLMDRLVERCPLDCNQAFLPPMISTAYPRFQTKLTSEWESIEAAREADSNNEAAGGLGEEMKADSVVRSTTYAIATFTSKILQPEQSLSGIRRRRSGAPDPQSTHIVLLSQPSTLQPLLSYLTCALRMRDTRCVATTAATLRAMLPFFAPSPPASTGAPGSGMQHDFASEVREYFSRAILEAAITSLNEMYFVDIHRDLAALIAGVVHYFAPVTDTPQLVLRSLQGLDGERVDAAIVRVVESRKEREMRAVVLELLEDIRGVRLSEVGRLGVGGVRERGSRGAQKWTTGGAGGMEVEGTGIARGGTPPEGGLGDMFGVQ